MEEEAVVNFHFFSKYFSTSFYMFQNIDFESRNKRVVFWGRFFSKFFRLRL